MSSVQDFAVWFWDHSLASLAVLVQPSSRIFWVYVLTSVAIAYLVYRRVKSSGAAATRQDVEAANGSFLKFLFPKSVWSHPSAWLDVRYLFFHHIFGFALAVAIGSTVLVTSYAVLANGAEPVGNLPDVSFLTIVAFTILITLLIDLASWYVHYLQHKIPFLWHFHKVHHSAEVMHPISNFREHPVDNMAYNAVTALIFGAVFALATRMWGYVPSLPTLLGVPVTIFVFNIVGYNLRHSHVWLRWPGVWSAVFPSPAHHHVHHSCHPDHLDKNFAFMFPVWDVLFGTYIMPEDNRDVKFGTVEDSSEMNSVLRLYWIPFRDVFRHYRRDPTAKSDPRVSDTGTTEIGKS